MTGGKFLQVSQTSTDAAQTEQQVAPSRSLRCPHCELSVVPEESRAPSVGGCVASLSLLLVCGWVGCCVLPFMWPVLQSVVLRCPRCALTLRKHSRLSVRKGGGKVITIKLGQCAIVLSQTYLFAMSALILLVGGFAAARWYLEVFGLPDIATKGEPVDYAWTDFVRDCGQRSSLGNPLKAEALFEEKYMDKTVTWKGRVHHLQEGVFHKHFLYIDMIPRMHHPGLDLRDVALLFGEREEYFPILKKIDEGAVIEFEATLLQLGRRHRPLLGVLWSLKETGERLEDPDVGALQLWRQRLGRSPVDVAKVAQRLRDAQQAVRERQEALLKEEGLEYVVFGDPLGETVKLAAARRPPLQAFTGGGAAVGGATSGTAPGTAAAAT